MFRKKISAFCVIIYLSLKTGFPKTSEILEKLNILKFKKNHKIKKNLIS